MCMDRDRVSKILQQIVNLQNEILKKKVILFGAKSLRCCLATLGVFLQVAFIRVKNVFGISFLAFMLRFLWCCSNWKTYVH